MIGANRNQLANVKNPYQGTSVRALCVCSAGLLRSPTMANVLNRDFGLNTRACGSSEAFALIPLSEALVEWADLIIFVNSENFQEALYHNPLLETQIREKSLVLDIPDNFGYNDPQLQEIIKGQFMEKYTEQERGNGTNR